jgi:hypothetical protein
MFREKEATRAMPWPKRPHMTGNDQMPATRSLPWSSTTHLLVIVALLLAGVALFFVAGMVEPDPLPGLIVLPAQARDHDNAAVIPDGERPPAGGIHHDVWLNCGVYREPVDSAQAVHTLEHGAVWITYRADIHPQEIAALEQRVWTESHTVLSPYPTQTSPIVLTAWSVQLEVDSAADPRIDDFIRRYRLGATAPESGGSCTGGAGEPIN